MFDLGVDDDGDVLGKKGLFQDPHPLRMEEYVIMVSRRAWPFFWRRERRVERFAFLKSGKVNSQHFHEYTGVSTRSNCVRCDIGVACSKK